MKKCKSCQKEIDDKATKCPHCTSDQRNWIARHPILTVILALIVIGMFSTDNSNKDQSNATSNPNSTTEQTATTEVKTEEDSKVPAEYRSALNQATTYANTMHLSKKGVYAQLVSEYGGKFTPPAAQYAIDNVKADWNANALAQAKTYQNTMNLSPAAVRDQLVSAYGGQFTEAEADYAIEHLN